MSTQFWEKLISLAPRIKGPIQLAGFAFSTLAAALIYRVNADNITALAVVGAIGVAVLSIPLAFDGALIGQLPTYQRGPFLLVLIALLLFSFGALAVVTASAVLAPDGIRFDAALEPIKTKIIRNPDGTARMQLTWALRPLSSRANEGATVFTGIVVIHDEEKIKEGGSGKKTSKSCTEINSCVGSYYFSDLAESPLLVRSAAPDAPFTTTVDIKEVPKKYRVWWEFYQTEGTGKYKCGFDNSSPAPVGGIPKLAMYDQGQKVGDSCYRSYGQQTILSNPT